jgi:hypothetical protein
MTSTVRDHRYGLTRPCRKCPFRTDVEPYLRAERAREIALSIQTGGEFPCHTTTVLVEDEQGEQQLADDPARSRVCAGALGVQVRSGELNQMTRIAERLGVFDPERLDTSAVYPSFLAFTRANRDADPQHTAPTVTDPRTGEELPFEHCGVVDDDCEDPAGFLIGGAATDNSDEPTCNPLTDTCEGCGNLACGGCRSPQWDDADGKFCTVCYNPDAD